MFEFLKFFKSFKAKHDEKILKSKYSEQQINEFKKLFDLKIAIQSEKYHFSKHNEEIYLNYWKDKRERNVAMNYLSNYFFIKTSFEDNIYLFMNEDIEQTKIKIKNNHLLEYDEKEYFYGFDFYIISESMFVYLYNIPCSYEYKHKHNEFSPEYLNRIKLMIESANILKGTSYSVLSMLIKHAPYLFSEKDMNDWLFDYIINVIDKGYNSYGRKNHLFQEIIIYGKPIIKGKFVDYLAKNYPDSMIRNAPEYLSKDVILKEIEHSPIIAYNSCFVVSKPEYFREILKTLLNKNESWYIPHLVWILANNREQLSLKDIENIIEHCKKNQNKGYTEINIPNLEPSVYKNGEYKFRLHKDIYGNVIDQDYCETHFGGLLYIKDGKTIQEDFNFDEYMKRRNTIDRL